MPQLFSRSRVLCLGLLGFLAAVPAAIPTNVTFTNFFPGVSLSRPLYFAEVPGKDSNYVVLEQQIGVACVVHRVNGAWVKDTLVKVSVFSADNSLGLLGFAFHPNFVTNHKYYIFYSPTKDSNVVEERQTDASLIKDAGVAPRQLFRFSRASTSNDGGNLAFGPDGFLYLGIGDGGDPQGDTPNRAQSLDTLLGKILRVDVDTRSGNKPYGIPADNPYASGTAGRPEIYALGLRSPWRWSFDALTGNLWVSDVGNATWEEVDTVARGANMGWRLMEGADCQAGVTCSKTGMTLPFAQYGHTGGNNAIIGGFVYRGNPNSPFYGVYFYGDNGSGRVRALKMSGGMVVDSATMTNSVTGISSFGLDSHGGLFATSVINNMVYRLTSTDLQPVTAWQPARKAGRSPAAVLERHRAAGLDLRDLQGKRTQGRNLGNGVYILRDAKNIPTLVPLLQ